MGVKGVPAPYSQLCSASSGEQAGPAEDLVPRAVPLGEQRWTAGVCVSLYLREISSHARLRTCWDHISCLVPAFLNNRRILKLQDRNVGRDLTVPCCSAEHSSVNNPQPPEGGREGQFWFCLTRVSCHYHITISNNFVLRTRYNTKSSLKRTKPEDLSGVCCEEGRI